MGPIQPRVAARPPHRQGPIAAILTPPSGAPTYWQVVSRRVVGVLTHYLLSDHRTVPCTADEATGRPCHVDHRQTSTRWQGWIAVQSRDAKDGRFVALTSAAVRDMPELLDDDSCIRGITLGFARTGEFKRARLRVFLSPEQWSRGKLLAEPDVMAFLTNLWGPMLRPVADPNVEWNFAPEGGGRNE